MKIKVILAAALLGVAAVSASAGVRFGISIGLPVVSAPVVFPAPVAPVTVVPTAPPCPGVDYVWVPGFWSYGPCGRCWISGAWQYHPADYDRGHDRRWHNWDQPDHGWHRR